MEKIQSANSRLIADMNGDENQASDADTVHTNKGLLQPKHRVTFSSDVEEYDDDFDCADADAEYKDDEEIDGEVAEITDSDKMSIEIDQIDGLMRFMVIEEKIGPEMSGDDNEYPIRLEDVNDVDKQDDECHGTEVKSKSTDQNDDLIEPTYNVNDNIPVCRPCTKTESLAIQQTNRKRPTSSKPIGAKQYQNEINRSKNRIASASASTSTYNRTMGPSNDLFKIHLNIRTCCENKYLDNDRLPRYNGYNSQYGLSKDQMEQRKLNHQKYMEQRTRRNRDILKAKQQIACLNEQAFRQWLIRKNHSTRSKYKNMYDL